MTQGFPVGQPGYPAPPQGGYSQQATQRPQRKSEGKGLLIALGRVALAFPAFSSLGIL